MSLWPPAESLRQQSLSLHRDNLEIPNDADYLAGCDCTGSCQNADHCSCHSMFEGAPSHAYDDQVSIPAAF